MHTPRNTGRLYRIEVTRKGDVLLHDGVTSGLIQYASKVWEGRAACLVDALTQARQSYDATKHWALFKCKILEISD